VATRHPLIAAPEPEDYRAVRARLERYRWKQLKKGADGLGMWQHKARGLNLIHSIGLESDGELWEHLSVSTVSGEKLPSWDQIRNVFHEVAGPEGLGIIVVAPESEHVNLDEVAHVFRCLTRRPLPDFTRGSGTI
jgi:hypothetical protein